MEQKTKGEMQYTLLFVTTKNEPEVFFGSEKSVFRIIRQRRRIYSF